MASLLFNDHIISEDAPGSLLSNRGFLYGDGFFETMVLRNGHIFFLEAHLERALTALNALQLTSDKTWNLARLKKLLHQVWTANDSPPDVVFKWIVWRNSDGLYSPSNERSSHYLIELKPYRAAPKEKAQAYIANTVANTPSVYSSFKRLSAMHYVLAGIEKTNRQADELILTDSHGNLSEATSSCLFWMMNHRLYTPSLDTGCIEGVVRKTIFKWAKEHAVPLDELKIDASALSSEATVFTGNVAGLSMIGKLEDTSFKNDLALYTTLQHDLFDATSFAQNL
jgi:4-amino-4-deoxychorismate lyase